MLLNITIGLAPVLAFLAILVVLDSYKLITFRSAAVAITVGGAAALVCLLIHTNLIDLTGWNRSISTRYVAPVTEEVVKAIYLIFLVRSGRVGFLVDAAIYGFAVGTGFALVENVYYLQSLGSAGPLLWVIRGFGTAVLHGSTMAIFALLSKGFSDRHQSTKFHLFLPGLAAAMAIHSLFNHFILPPLATTLLFLIVLPPVVLIVFERSERATRDWLGVGLDADAELLELILEGKISESPVGRYLQSLKAKFPGTVVGDMLCLLQIHLELSLRAKGILMAREAGLQVPVDDRIRANLKELKFLERTVGRTGRLAMEPFLKTSSRDLWQLYMLGK